MIYIISLRYIWKSESLTTYFIICMTKPPGHLNIKLNFLGIGIPIIKIRQSWDCLIFIMGISVLLIWHFNIETVCTFQGFSAPFSDILWVSRCFISPATGVFVQKCIHKHNMKALDYWPFVRGIHQWIMDSPVMWKAFSCHDIIMGRLIMQKWPSWPFFIMTIPAWHALLS